MKIMARCQHTTRHLGSAGPGDRFQHFLPTWHDFENLLDKIAACAEVEGKTSTVGTENLSPAWQFAGQNNRSREKPPSVARQATFHAEIGSNRPAFDRILQNSCRISGIPSENRPSAANNPMDGHGPRNSPGNRPLCKKYPSRLDCFRNKSPALAEVEARRRMRRKNRTEKTGIRSFRSDRNGC